MSSSPLIAYLQSQHLHPTPAFIDHFTAHQPASSQPAIVTHRTAQSRFLNWDLRLAHSPPGPAALLPAELVHPTPPAPAAAAAATATVPPPAVARVPAGAPASRPPPAPAGYLPGPLLVQVGWLEDVSRSKWSQATELDEERLYRGRERVVGLPAGAGADGEDNDDGLQQALPQSLERGPRGALAPPGAAAAKNVFGPFKLHIQDANGAGAAIAMTTTPIDGIDSGMQMGSKLLLTGVVVSHGILLLDKVNTKFLGGKVDTLVEAFSNNRSEYLKQELQSINPR